MAYSQWKKLGRKVCLLQPGKGRQDYLAMPGQERGKQTKRKTIKCSFWILQLKDITKLKIHTQVESINYLLAKSKINF